MLTLYDICVLLNFKWKLFELLPKMHRDFTASTECKDKIRTKCKCQDYFLCCAHSNIKWNALKCVLKIKQLKQNTFKIKDLPSKNEIFGVQICIYM